MKDDKIKKCLIAGYDMHIISQEELKEYWNYITNLQEENERLKEENKRIFSKVNDDELLISNAMNYAEAQEYKSRNEKAIEYIELGLANEEEAEELLNILNGDDK